MTDKQSKRLRFIISIVLAIVIYVLWTGVIDWSISIINK